MSTMRVWGPGPRKTIYKGGQRKWRLKGFVNPSVTRYVPRGLGSKSDLQAFDADITMSSTTTAVYQTIFLTVPGTASNSRFGDRTVARFLRYNLVLLPGSAADTTNFIRVVLFYDYQPNGAVPVTPQPLGATDTMAMPNVDLRYRFKILRDFIIPVEPQTLTYPGQSSNKNQDLIQRGFIKLDGLISQFTGSAGTVADIASGSFGIMILGDIVTGANKNASMEGFTRIIYSS